MGKGSISVIFTQGTFMDVCATTVINTALAVIVGDIRKKRMEKGNLPCSNSELKLHRVYCF